MQPSTPVVSKCPHVYTYGTCRIFEAISLLHRFRTVRLIRERALWYTHTAPEALEKQCVVDLLEEPDYDLLPLKVFDHVNIRKLEADLREAFRTKTPGYLTASADVIFIEVSSLKYWDIPGTRGCIHSTAYKIVQAAPQKFSPKLQSVLGSARMRKLSEAELEDAIRRLCGSFPGKQLVLAAPIPWHDDEGKLLADRVILTNVLKRVVADHPEIKYFSPSDVMEPGNNKTRSFACLDSGHYRPLFYAELAVAFSKLLTGKVHPVLKRLADFNHAVLSADWPKATELGQGLADAAPTQEKKAILISLAGAYERCGKFADACGLYKEALKFI